MVGFGGYCVAHLNKPARIRARAEASVNPQHNGYRIGAGQMVSVQAGNLSGESNVSGYTVILCCGLVIRRCN
jgi:hypothetical protein